MLLSSRLSANHVLLPCTSRSRDTFSSVHARPRRAVVPYCHRPSAAGDHFTPPSATDSSLTRRALLRNLQLTSVVSSIVLVTGAASANAKTFREGLNTYIKKKKLEPDEVIPCAYDIRQASLQISRIGDTVDLIQTEEALEESDLLILKQARSELRDGAAENLRSNLRTVSRYVVEQGEPQGKAALDQVFRTLEALDNELFVARRNEAADASTRANVRSELEASLIALDRLLSYVPSEWYESG